MSEENEHHVTPEAVTPIDGLGANFEARPLRQLSLSAKAEVWGDADHVDWEPTDDDLVGLGGRSQYLASAYRRCAYCGFATDSLEIDSANGNHHDISEANLAPADTLCHAWHHLTEIPDGSGVIAYLPGLSAADVNHLQRTIMVALQSDDKAVAADALSLLNWMGSHREYVKGALGTFQPAAFGSAIARMPPDSEVKVAETLTDLALIVSPKFIGKSVLRWTEEVGRAHPVNSWPKIFHDVMNVPV